ncbi:unnamed protein product [Rotaria sp. Silwood1]|nr:unnamed protein product [Rotaria sp. Silwood1]CAF3643500.1 unnamed protein product [Rotaria sp. Silwood1]CAF3665847.1 unnamed protein product [Rotaria sp. Silwood1]CAF3668217.1 unnamed protein product [Rotaria sp. Silwood1]CAF4709782.1 unnamed protein product [Rotaria sp. Silwood1]
MSSTPTTSINPSSSRVQSANKIAQEQTPIENNNAITEKTSRPPSASQKIETNMSTTPVTATTDNGISSDVPAIEKEEPVSSTVTSSSERPQSAAKNDLIVNPILNSTNDESKTSRPSSANPKAAESSVTAPASSRPSSANTKVAESSVTAPTSSRPPSANPKTNDLSSHGYTLNTNNSRPTSASQKNAESTTAAPTSSRPPSATPKANDLSSHGYTINTNNSRPPSASQKVAEPSTTAPINSRPPSANPKTNDLTSHANTIDTNNSRPTSASQKNLESTTAASTSPRPSSASQNTDTTKLNNSSNTPASTNSRPPSASQKTDSINTNNATSPRTSSRPPSASQKLNETTTDESATEQQNDLAQVNSNDSNITQPIIGRPSSAAKMTPTDESKIMITVDTNDSLNTQTENAPSSNENKSVEPISTTPRIGSASKNLQTSTTTENNS